MYEGATVAVVVPAYNEAGRVGRVIDTLPEYVDRAYVVDDGSTDGTWAEIRDHAERRNEGHDGVFEDLVVPIRHEENRGVGGAIKTGYRRAREESVDATAVLAGDGQMNPEELTRYLDPVVSGRAGYVKGDRFASPEDWADMPRLRLVGNVVLSYLTKVASGYWETTDSQNGYTVVSLSALRAVDLDGMYEFYGYCNDLLIRLNVAGVRVAEVPRSSSFVYDDWDSDIVLREYVPRVSAMLLRGFLRRLVRKYVVTDYHPLAAVYPLGAALSGAGLAGLVRSLRRREGGDAPGWLLSAALGALLVLYAAAMDREANRHLAVDPEADGEARAAGSTVVTGSTGAAGVTGSTGAAGPTGATGADRSAGGHPGRAADPAADDPTAADDAGSDGRERSAGSRVEPAGGVAGDGAASEEATGDAGDAEGSD